MYKIKININGLKNLNELSEFIKKEKIKLILFGEYHGFVNQIQVQKEIIRKTKPDFFLYEMLEDKNILNNNEAKKFLQILNNKKFSNVSIYENLKPIIKLAESFNLPLIGCDIRNMGVKKDWQKRKFTLKEQKIITKKRELRQSKVINKYAKKGLVFALIGNYHLRKDSFTFSQLKEKKFILVKPGFKWNKKFNHPTGFKHSEISYVVKLVKNYFG